MRKNQWRTGSDVWGGVCRALGRLKSWALQMTLQNVCYKAVVGIVIIHVLCVNIVCVPPSVRAYE